MPLLIVLLIVCFGGVAVLGIVAAIAVPALMRARMSANEAAAIARLRSMASAQMTWAALHGGRFARPACLGDPASCGDTSGTTYLPLEVASLESRSGYDHGFALSGSTDDGEEADAEPSDGTERRGFVYWATPSRPRATGGRSFCIDETAVLREYLDPGAWTAPAEDAPRCPDYGRPVG